MVCGCCCHSYCHRLFENLALMKSICQVFLDRWEKIPQRRLETFSPQVKSYSVVHKRIEINLDKTEPISVALELIKKGVFNKNQRWKLRENKDITGAGGG